MYTIKNHNKRVLNHHKTIENEKKKCRKKYRITRIENLSNELFYEIFDYLDGCDIFNSFSKLNSRFQNLLSHSSFLLKIHFSSSFQLETNCRTIILPNSYRIFSLKFSDEFLLDSFLCCCQINLHRFDKLQLLYLNSLPAYKLLVLLFDIISLPNLLSLTCSLTSCFLDVSYIYRIIFRFTKLKSFQLSLPFIEDLDDFEQALFVVESNQLSHLEYLKIDHCCTVDDFLSILSRIPNLKSLICQTLFQTEEYIEKNLCLSLPYLTNLIIEKCLLRFDVLENLLKKISTNLKNFQINIRYNDLMYINGHRWERFLSQSMTNLKKFQMKYYEKFDDRFKLISFHRLLHRFLTSFWIEKKWIFSFELNKNELIYSIDSIKNINFDIQYRCLSSQADVFHEHFNTIFPLLKITSLSIDCSQVSLLTCLKLLRLLPDLTTFQISSLSLAEAKRLSIEKSKILQSIAFSNKITNVHLNELFDIGQIQFLITLCPSMECFQTSFRNLIDLKLFLQWILTKQSNHCYLTRLSKLLLNISQANNQIVEDLKHLIEIQQFRLTYQLYRIGDKICLQWNV